MSDIETGGTAFPSTSDVQIGNYGTAGHSGMTLRDYFAAKAMQGIVSGDWNGNIIQMTNEAYQIADAMLEARK